MANVLIVDDDPGLQKILGLSLKKYQNKFKVRFASNGAEALEIIDQMTIDLVVTDIKMPEVDGLSLLADMSVKHPTTPCIVLTSYTIPGLEKNLSKKGFQFLSKPVDPPALASLIIQGLEQASSNSALLGVSTTGLMQIIEAESKTCLLSLTVGGRKQGKMYFHDGELYDATCGELHGEEAAIQLIAMDNVQMGYLPVPQEEISRTIEKGMQALILEAMRIKDEKSDDGESATDIRQSMSISLQEGIEQCEALHLNKAQKILMEVVSKDTKNVKAWLWLSRTLRTVKQIRMALKRAYQQDPKNVEVAQDIRKFQPVAKSDLQQVRRCPFCFAPNDIAAVQCNYCRAFLNVNNEILARIEQQEASKELLVALDRFDRVLSRELNIPVLFYAGLVCLNTKDYERALEYLEQVQQCVGSSNNQYSQAVDRIVSFIASRQSTNEKDLSIEEIEEQFVIEDEDSHLKTVLVVEDSQTTRKVIKMTLEANGFRVFEAVDGVEALSKINDHRFDIVLLDVMLPKLDGYGILSVLKQNDTLKEVPVVMLTSKDGLKDRLKGRFSSAKAYLTKPFKPDVLIKTVNKYIN